MKVFITFLGLLILQLGLITFEGDLNYYMYMQRELKEAAEECACGAALLIDEEAYVREGQIVFDKAAGQNYANDYLAHKLEMMLPNMIIVSSCELTYTDNAVTADILVKTMDIFTSPFVNMNSIHRSSRYEYVAEQR